MAAALAQRLRFATSAAAGISCLRRFFAASFASSFDPESPPRVRKIYIDTSKFPPPYNVSYQEQPEWMQMYHPPPSDPSDLHQVFLHIRSPQGLGWFYEGMHGALFALGRSYEACSINSRMMATGKMPEVVVPTAVISAYAGAGMAEKALQAFKEMEGDGVRPNAYTYTLLIEGLARGKMVEEAGKYLLEMVGAGFKPDVATIVGVFEGFVKEGKVDEGRKVVDTMKASRFEPDKKAVVMKLDKKGPFYDGGVELLLSK